MADLNTGLSASEVLEAFDRALHDYTDSQIDTMLAAKQAALTFDSMPTDGSTNPVRSDGIYDFVNSSVATNTANFIGTFNSVAELNGYSGTITNNDYAFVISTDSAGNTVYNRYKYNGSSWGFEYALNNSSFTAAQWATIQSGLTASDKTKLDGIEEGANKTVVDANLSQTSTNPVQNKVVNSALATKQDTIADLAEIRSGAAAGATAVQQTVFETDQQRQDALEAEDRAALVQQVDGGAKNLMENVAVSKTINSVDFTINADKTVTADGTATSAAWLVLSENKTLKAGTYVISGGTASVRVAVSPEKISTSIIAQSAGSPTEFTLENDTDSLLFVVRMSTNAVANNATVYPMICTKAAWDISQTYQPYRKDLAELTVDSDEDRAALVELVDGGAKNLLIPTAISGSAIPATLTVTRNSDDSITVNGYTESKSAFIYYAVENDDFKGKILGQELVLSGCPSGGSNDGYRLRAWHYDANGSDIASDFGDGVEFTFENDTSTYHFDIAIAPNTTCSNLTFRPMLCTAADYAISPAFVPYRPSWQEMYDMIKVLQNGA